MAQLVQHAAVGGAATGARWRAAGAPRSDTAARDAVDLDRGPQCFLSEVLPNHSGPVLPDDPPFRALTGIDGIRSRRRVLIVDGEEIVLDLVGSTLSASGLDLALLATRSGYEACVRFGGFEPELVILDIHMPDVDGREVLRSIIRAGAENTRFPALSGHPAHFEQMREIGCHDGLAKPFTIRGLMEKVASLLELELPQARSA